MWKWRKEMLPLASPVSGNCNSQFNSWLRWCCLNPRTYLVVVWYCCRWHSWFFLLERSMTCPCYPQWSMVFLWNSIKLLVWFILLHFSESGGKASERQFILKLIKKKKKEKKAGGKRKFYLHTYAVGLILKNFSLPFLEVAFSLSLEKAKDKKNMGEKWLNTFWLSESVSETFPTAM